MRDALEQHKEFEKFVQCFYFCNKLAHSLMLL